MNGILNNSVSRGRRKRSVHLEPELNIFFRNYLLVIYWFTTCSLYEGTGVPILSVVFSNHIHLLSVLFLVQGKKGIKKENTVIYCNVR